MKWKLVILALVLLCLSGRANASFDRVTFPSLDRETELVAYLKQPSGTEPYPGIIFLHGCSGVGISGTISNTYRMWSELLVKNSYAVLVIDSASSRGFGSTCGRSPHRKVMYLNRPKDAYAGLAFLQQQPRIDAEKIGLMGWSQGGGITLLTIVDRSIGRPVPHPLNDFAAAVAFYPSACSEEYQSEPYTSVPKGAWKSVAPLLVMHGEIDNWTPIEPCREFIEAARKRGEPVSIVGFPNAAHSFDAPNLKLSRRSTPQLKDGSFPLLGSNNSARRQSMILVLEFFGRHLR